MHQRTDPAKHKKLLKWHSVVCSSPANLSDSLNHEHFCFGFRDWIAVNDTKSIVRYYLSIKDRRDVIRYISNFLHPYFLSIRLYICDQEIGWDSVHGTENVPAACTWICVIIYITFHSNKRRINCKLWIIQLHTKNVSWGLRFSQRQRWRWPLCETLQHVVW
jgi:hypothetical protein